ncbi:MAG: SDR family oxidoreductase [Gammaproteobacteria bacterium]|nr:SDR family oxidoreductase [Gammaproteobacteria bacterium]
MDRLADKTAVITGGAGGIGSGAARLFAAEGANVLIVDLSEDALERTVRDIGSNRVSYCVADVTQADDNERMFATAEERYGGVDAFLANAGIEGAVAPIVETREEDFDRVIAVNVKGVWLGIKHAIPAMAKRGGGSIVVTSSVAGLSGTPGIAPYGTSKHAVIGLMRAAARECAPMNIRVNTVNPSPVETRMMRSLEAGMSPDDPEAARERIRGTVPLGRYAEPEDIAKVMLFLASDDAAFVTGSIYKADGGASAY